MCLKVACASPAIDVRVTAQLINSRDGTHLFSQTYDRDFSDVLKMQDEIAIALVRALQIEVSSEAAGFPADIAQYRKPTPLICRACMHSIATISRALSRPRVIFSGRWISTRLSQRRQARWPARISSSGSLDSCRPARLLRRPA